MSFKDFKNENYDDISKLFFKENKQYEKEFEEFCYKHYFVYTHNQDKDTKD